MSPFAALHRLQGLLNLKHPGAKGRQTACDLSGYLGLVQDYIQSHRGFHHARAIRSSLKSSYHNIIVVIRALITTSPGKEQSASCNSWTGLLRFSWSWYADRRSPKPTALRCMPCHAPESMDPPPLEGRVFGELLLSSPPSFAVLCLHPFYFCFQIYTCSRASHRKCRLLQADCQLERTDTRSWYETTSLQSFTAW